jgi:asparagine synthase (glutamine-hydrolysing)
MERKRIFVELSNKYVKWPNVKRDGYSLWIRGYAFINEEYYSMDSLLQYISKLLDSSRNQLQSLVLKELIPKLNGAWALVYMDDNSTIAGVDRFRSIPLFYAVKDGSVFLSDDYQEALKFLHSVELDDICAAEFLVTGYVTGKETIYKNLYQIETGEILEFVDHADSNVEIKMHRYYRYKYGTFLDGSEEELEDELYKGLCNVFSRFAKVLKGKTIAVPLSGGLDSRFVVTMFKKYGLENVICFSYGKPGNDDAESSKAVASALGYKWLFCEYNYPLWYKWFHEETMQEYLKYSGNGAGMFHNQDWPAIREILSKLSNNNITIIPGHSGDFLQGSFVKKNIFTINENTRSNMPVSEFLLSHSYRLWNWARACPDIRDLFMERIRKGMLKSSINNETDTNEICENWLFENRVAKYVINSVRVYEFFDCEWMLPWWDYDLMDLFLSIKTDMRYQRILFRKTLVNKVFTDDFSNLATIPTFGGPPLLESKVVSRKWRKKTGALHNYAYQNLKWIFPSFTKSIYRAFTIYKYTYDNSDFLAWYGTYVHLDGQERSHYFKLLLSKVKNSIDIPLGKLPPSVECILKPYIRRSVLTSDIVGLNSAYYLSKLSVDNSINEY